MAITTSHDEHRQSARLHPWIFKAVIGFVLWMIIAAWGFSSTWSAVPQESYTAVVLAVMSYFCIVAVGIAGVMTYIMRHSPDPARRDDTASRDSFHEWTSRQIEVSDGHQRGSHVAMDILLAPAAVAIGMTALVVVWHLAPG
jgi:hypothetical protein